jgi:hypothetical protein
MAITTDQAGAIVVDLRAEYGVYQVFDNDGKPFASEAAAQSWQDIFVAGQQATAAAAIAAQQAAQQAQLAAQKVLHITASSLVVQAGVPVAFHVDVKDGLGNTVPDTGTFYVPVIDDSGIVRKIFRCDVAAGAADVTLTFSTSGYYRLTQDMLNARLVPPGSPPYYRLPSPVEVTVYD